MSFDSGPQRGWASDFDRNRDAVTACLCSTLRQTIRLIRNDGKGVNGKLCELGSDLRVELTDCHDEYGATGVYGTCISMYVITEGGEV